MAKSFQNSQAIETGLSDSTQNASFEFSSRWEHYFFQKFQKYVHVIFKKHKPLKTRNVRANQAPINKTTIKEIIKRLRLKNKFLNTKSEIYRKAYKKQRNYLVCLIRKTNQKFFGNINTTDVTDNNTCLRTVKQLLTDKVKTRSKITLIENRKV